MNVLYIFDEDDMYGAPKTGMEMISGLKEKYNINPIVITSKKNNVNKWCDENKIENYVTKHHKYTYIQTSSFFYNFVKFIPRWIRYKIGNIIALKTIKEKIDLSKIDLIHSNISSLDIGILISKRYKIPNIMHIREFGKLDFNMKSYRKNYIAFLNENVTRFIAISNAIKDNWISRGLSEDKVTTIYNGVNDSGILCRETGDFKSEILKIVIIGSISNGKGQIELIKAIGMLLPDVKKNIRLDIVGSGYKENEKQMLSIIKKYKLESIINWKKYDSNIKSKIKDYHIGCVCSSSEGFGRVTVEYMIAGIGIIASDTGANIELIENGINGFLYKKGNVQDLTDKIELLYNNRDLIYNMATKAKKIYKTKYTTDIFVNNVYEYYMKLLK